jgi:hypothetical protein
MTIISPFLACYTIVVPGTTNGSLFSLNTGTTNILYVGPFVGVLVVTHFPSRYACWRICGSRNLEQSRWQSDSIGMTSSKHFDGHQGSIGRVKDKRTLVMISRSGAGKSLTGCFLIGRALTMQEKRVTSQGKIRSYSVLAPYNPQPGDFKVSEGADAGTKFIETAHFLGILTS